MTLLGPKVLQRVGGKHAVVNAVPEFSVQETPNGVVIRSPRRARRRARGRHQGRGGRRRARGRPRAASDQWEAAPRRSPASTARASRTAALVLACLTSLAVDDTVPPSRRAGPPASAPRLRHPPSSLRRANLRLSRSRVGGGTRPPCSRLRALSAGHPSGPLRYPSLPPISHFISLTLADDVTRVRRPEHELDLEAPIVVGVREEKI